MCQKKDILMKIRTNAVHLYIIFLLGIFPFLMHDGYFDISKAKSDIFMAATAIITVVCLITTILLKEWRWLLRKCNWLIYVMAIIIGVTTLNAWHIPAALTGQYGRYQGAYVCWAYCLAALWIINFGTYKDIYLKLLIFTGCAVAFIGILNFYEVDVLGILEQVKEKQKHEYLSTIGHMNTFSAYLSILVPVTIVSAITEKNRPKKFCLYAVLFVLFGGMIVSTCDSVYITLGVLFLALPFWCLSDYDKRISMAEVLIVFSVSLLFFSILNHALVYPLDYVNGMAKHFLDTKICVVIFVGFLLLALAFRFSKDKLEKVKEKLWQKIWLAITLVSSVIVSSIYIINNPFDGNWGNLRGTIWMQGMDFYSKQPLNRKLLGIGLDSVLLVFRSFYGEDAKVKGKAYYNNLHNEYLQYLVTIGLIGLMVYLLIMGIMLYRVIRKAKWHNGAFAISMAALCYLVQAISNISMSSVTTIILALLYIGQTINLENIEDMRTIKSNKIRFRKNT